MRLPGTRYQEPGWEQVRKLLVNWPGGQSWIGEVEVLRGDVLDTVAGWAKIQMEGWVPLHAVESRIHEPSALRG